MTAPRGEESTLVEFGVTVSTSGLTRQVLRVNQSSNTAQIILDGELDAYSAPVVRMIITSLINQGFINVIVILEKITYIDATGIGVLIGRNKQCVCQNGRLVLVCLDDTVAMRAFELCKLRRTVFDIFPSLNEAIASIACKPEP